MTRRINIEANTLG